MPVWPPVREHRIRIGAVDSAMLRARLVPRDGSVVELRAIGGLVRETDPEGRRRTFGNEDIVTLRLSGLEDDADRRSVRVRVANELGRTSVYGALEDVTAWTVIKLLFGSVPGAVVGFFVTRWLKRRNADPPAPQPTG